MFKKLLNFIIILLFPATVFEIYFLYKEKVLQGVKTDLGDTGILVFVLIIDLIKNYCIIKCL